jgi:hypothetical protein
MLSKRPWSKCMRSNPTTPAQQAQLVLVTRETSRKLNNTNKLAKLLKNLYKHSLLLDPSFSFTELGITRQSLDNDFDIMDALMAAHIHRFSMDLLSPQAIEDRAFLNQMKLPINHPSDLFLILGLLLRGVDTVKLFIHKPMAPIDSLLSLLKFHPLMLPFTDTDSLLPDLNNILLALSKGGRTWLHSELSPASLVACHKATSLYLGE